MRILTQIIVGLSFSVALAGTETEVLKRLENLNLKKENCPKSEVVDVDALRLTTLTEFVDLELQRRLRLADEKVKAAIKAPSRVAMFSLCSQRKYGSPDVSRGDIARILQKYRLAVFDSKFDESSFTLPNAVGTRVDVKIDRGAVTDIPTGWVGATYTLPEDSKTQKTVTVWKHVHDAMDLSCVNYSIDSRTEIFSGLVRSSGHKEVFTVTDRKLAEKNGFAFRVESCVQDGSR